MMFTKKTDQIFMVIQYIVLMLTSFACSSDESKSLMSSKTLMTNDLNQEDTGQAGSELPMSSMYRMNRVYTDRIVTLQMI